MSYIAPLTRADADEAVGATLDAVRGKIGMVPNLYSTLARSPAALHGLLSLNEAINTGRLTAREREIVALATSQWNSCQYCLSAHTLLGKQAGLSAEQGLKARAGRGTTAREAAIAEFTRSLNENHGHVPTEKLDEYRRAGLTDGELFEVIANLAATVLTNFANNVARTAIDFPVVDVELG